MKSKRLLAALGQLRVDKTTFCLFRRAPYVKHTEIYTTKYYVV